MPGFSFFLRFIRHSLLCILSSSSSPGPLIRLTCALCVSRFSSLLLCLYSPPSCSLPTHHPVLLWAFHLAGVSTCLPITVLIRFYPPRTANSFLYFDLLLKSGIMVGEENGPWPSLKRGIMLGDPLRSLDFKLNFFVEGYLIFSHFGLIIVLFPNICVIFYNRSLLYPRNLIDTLYYAIL